MNELRTNIAKNIAQLRSAAGMTQTDLAEKLNYSDKAISKWERAESVPDITVLTQIADLFHVSLDVLVKERVDKQDTPQTDEVFQQTVELNRRRRGIITGLAILLVWMIATLVFVVMDMLPYSIQHHWLAFVWAIPVSMLIWLIFNSIWFKRRRNFLIISLLMWSVFCAIFLLLFLLNVHIWQIFLLGIPGQFIIVTWSRLPESPSKKR